MSSEDIQLLEESHHHENRKNDDEDEDEDEDEDDNSAENDDGFLNELSPEHLETGLPNLPRSLTYVNGLAIIISLQVGAGIFSAPAAVRTNVSTSTAALLVWILAGILVWTGAAAFIELGTRIPHNGGMQEYLRHYYGDVYGFLFAWTWILLSRSCAMAMVGLVFSEYLFKTLSPDRDVDVWILKGTALLAIASITLLNFMGTHVGTSAANVFLVLKVFALSTIAVAGVVFAVSDFTREEVVAPPAAAAAAPAPDPGDSSLWASMGGFADAILASLFAYGGCESLGFVVGEIKDPRRTLPRVIHSAMAMIIALFVLSNFALYHELSKEVLEKTNAVAVAFGREILGEPGAWFYALMVCLCSLGSLNAVVFSAGRLTQAAGSRNYLPAFLGTADSTNGKSRIGQAEGNTRSFCAGRCRYQSQTKDQNMPAKAMLLNATIAAAYVLVGSFRELLNFKAMTELSVFVATVSGVFVLRSRPADPDKEPAGGHYRTSTINLVIFCSIGSLIVIRSAITHIFQFLIITVFFGAGLIIYRLAWWQTMSGTTLTAVLREVMDALPPNPEIFELERRRTKLY